MFVPDDRLVEACVEPWRGLPLWVPRGPDNDGLWAVDGSASFDYGFSPRPLSQTVADTWEWLQREGSEWEPTARAAVHGIDPEVEQGLLADSG